MKPVDNKSSITLLQHYLHNLYNIPLDQKLYQLEYILHLFLKIIISAYYNYLQVSHFLVKLEPVFLLLPPWQVKPNWWAAPTVGPTIGNNHWQQPLATSESVLLKIIISI